jgi:hypothetical protein
MVTPKDFDGKISIPLIESSSFFPISSENNNEPFDIWFYRRATDNKTLKEFLDSIVPENMGYDKPTNQLFYRSLSGKLYRMDFTEIR